MRAPVVLGSILLVGAVAAAALFLATDEDGWEAGSDTAETGTEASGDAPSQDPASLEGRGTHAAPEEPAAEPAVVPRDRTEEDRTYLGVKHLRSSVIQRLYDDDERVAALVPALERVIEEGVDAYPAKLGGRYDIWRAMVVVMRTEGSRRHLRQLGRWGAAQQRESAPRVARSQRREAGWFGWGPTRVDPATGRALYILYWHATDTSYPQALRDALFAAGDLLAEDPVAGRARIVAALRDARGAELDAFLHAAAVLGPVPAAFGPAFVGAFARSDAERRLRLLRRLREEALLSDFATEGAGEVIAAYLVRSWEDLEPGLRWLVVRVLGCLDAPTPAVLQHLMGLIPSKEAKAAIEALGELGPGAASVAHALIAKAGQHWSYGPLVSRAVAKMRDPSVLPYLCTRLEVGDDAERRDIAEALADMPGAERLDALLLEEVRRGSWAALRTLVHWDPGASRAVTRDAFVLALVPTATKTLKLNALRLSLELEHVPDDVVDAMLASLEDDEVRNEATRAVQGLGRLGDEARRWKGRLMRAQAEAEARGDPRPLHAVLGLLGEISGRDEDVRARLLELLDLYAARAFAFRIDADGVRTLQAVLWGLGGVEDPTRGQVVTVARLHGTRTKGVAGLPDTYHLMTFAGRVLEKPSWCRVRLREGIRLSWLPRVREATWGHEAPETSGR